MRNLTVSLGESEKGSTRLYFLCSPAEWLSFLSPLFRCS